MNWVVSDSAHAVASRYVYFVFDKPLALPVDKVGLIERVGDNASIHEQGTSNLLDGKYVFKTRNGRIIRVEEYAEGVLITRKDFGWNGSIESFDYSRVKACHGWAFVKVTDQASERRNVAGSGRYFTITKDGLLTYAETCK